MLYEEIQPHPDLSTHVKCFWIMESADVAANQPGERVLPDGCVELVFHFHDPFKSIDGSNTRQSRCSIIGQLERFITIEPTGRIGIMGIRFYPWGARPFLDVQLDELTGRSVSIDLLWGRMGRELEERLMDASGRAAVEVAQSFLLDRLRNSTIETEIEMYAATTIMQTGGQITVADLATQIGIGERQLERRFRAAVGISPKQLGRIARFQTFFRLRTRYPNASFTELAHACNYYDQAHFIREFKAYAGLSPRAFFASDRLMTDFFLS